MKILVPLKRVADPDNVNKVKISGDGKQVVSEGLEWKMNPFDEYALEAALRLTENASTKERLGEVVVVSIGPADARNTIIAGLGMGADRGILVEGNDQNLDSTIVAHALKAVVKRESPTLVLMGKQSVDGDSNVAGQVLAELLGWPMATFAMKIQTNDDGKTLTVGRETDTGVATLKITGPAVLTASDRILHPHAVKNGVTPADFAYPESQGGRYASLPNIMKAKKKPLDQLTLSDLNVTGSTAVEYHKFELPPARTGNTVFVESVDELFNKLHSEAKVI